MGVREGVREGVIRGVSERALSRCGGADAGQPRGAADAEPYYDRIVYITALRTFHGPVDNLRPCGQLLKDVGTKIEGPQMQSLVEETQGELKGAEEFAEGVEQMLQQQTSRCPAPPSP